ncbi:MAG: very short patch repair endonuclease [Candidatus Levyibacteriota bacterium]
MDTHTPKQRTYNMSQIKSSNTLIELKFRKFIWEKKLRGYRLRSKILGKPDIYFPKQKLAVFIDGCFWHKCPIDFIRPQSKNDYWDKKIKNNVKRDKKIDKELKKENIEVLRFWEHEIANNIIKCYRILIRLYEKSNNI